MARHTANWKKNVFVGVLLLVVAYFAYGYMVAEGFDIDIRRVYSAQSNVNFMSADDTSHFIMNDPDGYFKSMSPLDWMARRVQTDMAYRKRAGSAARDFTAVQQSRIASACQKADAFFTSGKCNQSRPGFGLDAREAEAVVGLPWIFALTKGNAYEDGLPHTRQNVIFLSTLMDQRQDKLLQTLIHEKIHVYQRAYPDQVNQKIEQMGFLRWKQRLGVPRIRANPDLNAYVYINPQNQSPMMALYTSDQPESVEDVVIPHKNTYEHPYEQMAYEIAALRLS
jgi:hypothetical protein